MAQFLFVSSPLQGLFKSMESNADMAIHNLSDDTLLSQSVETLVQRIFDENSIKVPTLDLNSVCRTYTDASVPQAPVPNPMYDSQPRVPGRIHTLHIPYAGPEHMFHYMPMVPSPNKILGDTTSLEVTIDVGGVWLSADDIDKQFDDAIATIEDSLSRLRKDVEPFNKGLPGRIRASAERRRQAAEQTRQTTQAIKYPLRQVGNAPQTYRLPERPRQIVTQPVQRTPTEQEFIISEEDYQNILRICESMSLVIERSPRVFENAEEEHIRVHYLVQLNGQYQGAATGETFNNVGKTDILIRHQNKNVFVAECKFWGGYKELVAATNQLLSYTTWRDTKTALIVFSRNADFTNVIEEAQRAMREHPNYRSGPTKQGETRFRYVFSAPDDQQRNIIITLMLFNMPKPTSRAS